MPYPYTLFLHSLLIILSLVSLLYLYLYRGNFPKLSPLKGYFLWFAFFILYNVAHIFAALLLQKFPIWSGIGYILALFFAAIATWHAFRVGLYFFGVTGKKYATLSWLYIIGVMSALSLHILFFEIPQPANENWIFWYSNRPIAFTYIFFMFVTGWTFAFGIMKSLSTLPGVILKLRALFLAFPALILPLAAYFYFAPTSVRDIKFAMAINIFALLSFILGNVVLGIVQGKHSENDMKNSKV